MVTVRDDDAVVARCVAVGATLARHGAADPGLRLAVAVAASSEGVSAAERDAVSAIARAAGVTASALDALLAESVATLLAAD